MPSDRRHHERVGSARVGDPRPIRCPRGPRGGAVVAAVIGEHPLARSSRIDQFERPGVRLPEADVRERGRARRPRDTWMKPRLCTTTRLSGPSASTTSIAPDSDPEATTASCRLSRDQLGLECDCGPSVNWRRSPLLTSRTKSCASRPSPPSPQPASRIPPSELHYDDTAYLVSPTAGVFSMANARGRCAHAGRSRLRGSSEAQLRRCASPLRSQRESEAGPQDGAESATSFVDAAVSTRASVGAGS